MLKRGVLKLGKSFVLRGNICYSKNMTEFETAERAYLVCEEGVSRGVFKELPDRFGKLPCSDFGDCIIIPGLTDLHVHAPQFAFRGLGMDLELLEWLNKYALPEEAKYAVLSYAEKAYSLFVDDLKRGPNTRAVIFATCHVPATISLMRLLDDSQMVTMVGKVNMDRNAPDNLREESAERSAETTVEWLEAVTGRYERTYPILTPRFIPSCSDELMKKIGVIAKACGLPVQSHLSENLSEIAWVKELCPWAGCYGEAYDHFGLFGAPTPAIMAHCVHSGPGELELMKKNGVFIAHSPQSNTNILSGVAPVRKYLKAGLKVGLASDIGGGSDSSIFKIMRSAIEASKLRWRLVDQAEKPLTTEEAFYLGTIGGGEFFGKVGSFADGCEFDAVVIDDSNLTAPYRMPIADRVARIIYFSDDRNIRAKYVRGSELDLSGVSNPAA